MFEGSMNNKRLGITILISAVLLVAAFAGTITYFLSEINSLNKQIIERNSEISDLNSQIANLTKKLSTANLTASLTVEDYSDYFLSLDGSVSNIGRETATNAGLHVTGYDAQGVLKINATVPLAFQEEFSNPFGNLEAGGSLIGGSHSVTSLDGGQSAQIRLDIDHTGSVANWTIIPIWTTTA